MAFDNSLKNFSLGIDLTKLEAVSLKDHMTLRNACIDYRDANGSCWVPNDMPEASAAVSAEQVPCLNGFRNIIGHMESSEIICFRLDRANNLVDLVSILNSKLSVALNTGRLWAIPGTVKYRLSGDDSEPWSVSSGIVPRCHYDVLNKLRRSPGPPLSASITHAAMEADHYMNDVAYEKVFLYPHNAAISVGLIGSLHDNECIDMSPGEEGKVADMEGRSYKIDEYIGYICAGHTSHSTEAGRVRRVTCSTRVRILSNETVHKLYEVANHVVTDAKAAVDRSSEIWTVFCMGVYCTITCEEMILLCSHHRLLSLLGPTKFSLHVNENEKFAVISISCGTLIKQCSNGYWADNVEVYKSSRMRCGIKPKIDIKGRDQVRACFSAYFNLIPYMNENRAPRPLIASVQTPLTAPPPRRC